MLNNKDNIFMTHAIELAKKGIYTTSPNPNVGCVIVKDDLIIGEGYHQKAGSLHAEVYALEMAGDQARGADLYVTLEPCFHFGKTPPCIEKIIQSKIKRVIIGMQDPYHEVSGRSIEKLKNTGIEVIVGCLEFEVQNLNLGFISRIQRNKPWVTVKIAASLDGKTALSNGLSHWITNKASRRDVQYLRARSDVLITGSGTVLQDNPHMKVRDIGVEKQPIRLVIDSQLVTDPTANIYDENARVIIATLNKNETKLTQLRTKNVEIWDELEINNKINLVELLHKLSLQQMNYVLVEAGMNLNAQFLKYDLIDELIIYFAPSILGNKAIGMFNIKELTKLSSKFDFYFYNIEQLDTDIKITLRKK